MSRTAMFGYVKCTSLVSALLLVYTIDETFAQITKQTQLTQFQMLVSIDGSPACSVSTAPYKAYTVDRLSSCTYDCKILKRQTSNSVVCVGFNYNEQNDVRLCQLFAGNQRLYFAVQPACRYFMNVEVVGLNADYAVCPSSFTYDNDVTGCYKNVKVTLDWNAAALYCQSLVPGGHLVFINSSQENAAMSSLINDTQGCIQYSFGNYMWFSWWIGLQLLNPNVGSLPFCWKFNSTSVVAQMTYSNWGPGQPDGYATNERCVDLMSPLQWNDAGCAYNMCFICELDL